MKFHLIFVCTMWTSCLCINVEQTDLECPDECACHYSKQNWVTDCSDSGLSRVPYEDLSLDAYIVDLNYNNITDLETFPANMTMRRLQVAGNKLTALKRKMFTGLYHLINADFSYNKISKVEPDSFQESSSFITLEMRGNPLDPVEGPFLSQISLLNLDINNCGLRFIGENFFSNISSLGYLELSNNPIGSLTSGVFRTLTSLKILKMNNCNLTSVEKDVFHPLENINHLEITENRFHITEWPLVFHKLRQLEYIDLRNSNLTTFPENIFENNTKLKILILAYNDLFNFEMSSALQFLHELEILDLSYCNLSHHLSVNTFKNSTKLKSLFLSGNTLLSSDLLEALSPLEDLQNLVLSNCGLKLIPDVFNNFKSLRGLDLSYNHLEDMFPDLFLHLENLAYLNMGYSNISYIAPNSFSNLTSLKRLIMAGNDLYDSETITLFNNLTKLESLDLSFCSLTDVDFFTNLTYEGITELHLAGNPLNLPKHGSLLPETFSKLIYLDLSNCNLTFIPEQAFNCTRNIRILSLSDNMFDSSSDLAFLDVLSDLQSLDLRNNRFKTFDPKSIFANTQLTNLKLMGNPWKCECYIAGLWDWASLLQGNLNILEGVVGRADYIKKTKYVGKRMLICSYDSDKVPLTLNNTGKGYPRRVFKHPLRIVNTPYRTWAKYVKESGCKPTINHTKVTRAAEFRRLNLGPNNWALAVVNSIIVIGTIMGILVVRFLVMRKRGNSAIMLLKNNFNTLTTSK